MPGHLADHHAAGRHHWGLFLVSSRTRPLRPLADTLYVYWDVSEAEQWVDLVEWLPV